MERLQFETTINASKDKVWETLWNDVTYRMLTSAFSEGSYAESDWKEGSKIYFLDGKGSGMVSMIAENKPNEYMSFIHMGMLDNGVEDTTSDKIKSWQGAMENYYLSEENGVTRLKVESDITSEYKDYMLNAWPKALEQLKQLSEK